MSVRFTVVLFRNDSGRRDDHNKGAIISNLIKCKICNDTNTIARIKNYRIYKST